MPFADPETQRTYQRDYKRLQRAGGERLRMLECGNDLGRGRDLAGVLYGSPSPFHDCRFAG